jgi:hypothetical protein
MSSRVSTLAILLTLFAVKTWSLPGPVLAGPGASPGSSYTFPEDDKPVFVMTSRGTMVPMDLSFTLYASGTAVIENSIRAGSEEVVLTLEEREAILRDIVDGDLLNYDAAAFSREQDRISGLHNVGDSPNSDLAAFVVTMRVLQDDGRGAPKVERAATVHIYGASRLAREFPSIRAYRALADLEKIFGNQLSRTEIAK